MWLKKNNNLPKTVYFSLWLAFFNIAKQKKKSKVRNSSLPYISIIPHGKLLENATQYSKYNYLTEAENLVSFFKTWGGCFSIIKVLKEKASKEFEEAILVENYSNTHYFNNFKTVAITLLCELKMQIYVEFKWTHPLPLQQLCMLSRMFFINGSWTTFKET